MADENAERRKKELDELNVGGLEYWSVRWLNISLGRSYAPTHKTNLHLQREFLHIKPKTGIGHRIDLHLDYIVMTFFHLHQTMGNGP